MTVFGDSVNRFQGPFRALKSAASSLLPPTSPGLPRKRLGIPFDNRTAPTSEPQSTPELPSSTTAAYLDFNLRPRRHRALQLGVTTSTPPPPGGA